MSKKKIFGIMFIAALYVGQSSDRGFEYVEELVPEKEIEIIRSKGQWMGDYEKQWLLKIDNPQVVQRLVRRKRLYGENLAANADWIEEARQFAPATLKNRFNHQSDYMGIFFQRGTKNFGKSIDIVISADQKLVYMKVWGT